MVGDGVEIYLVVVEAEGTLIGYEGPMVGVGVGINLAHPVVGAYAIGRFGGEEGEGFVARVEEVYATVGAHPDCARGVLIESRNVVVAPVGGLVENAVGLHRHAVVAVEAVFSAKPHEAHVVLNHGFHR